MNRVTVIQTVFITLLTVLLIVSSIIIGCEVVIPIKLNTSDIYGKYLVRYEFGNELLTLESTGKYEQKIEIYGNLTSYSLIMPTKGSTAYSSPTSVELSQQTTILQFSSPTTILKNEGRWWYEVNTKQLVLEKPLIVINGFGEINKDIKIPLPDTEKFLAGRCLPSKVCFAINEDLGYMYIKQ